MNVWSRMGGVAAKSVRRRRLLLPSAFGLLLVVVPFAHAGAAGIFVGAVLLLALFATVFVHRSLRANRADKPHRPVFVPLRTPRQVAEATFLVVGVGALVTMVVSLVLAAAASSVVGDGSLLVRLLLVVFVLGPCMSVGRRCGRWWAFTGAGALVPLLGFAVLLAGPRSLSGVGFVMLAVDASAFAVASGSLDRELAFAVGSRQSGDRRRAEGLARRPAAAGEQVGLRSAGLGR